jgi:hypothetical protein
MKQKRRLVILLSGVAALVLALALAFVFDLSVRLWGSWWRIPDMPTAEEWSALFGVSALVAVFFAWQQLRQVDESNRELIASNQLTRQVQLETIRPRVQVYLQANRSVWKRRDKPVDGQLHITVVNTGATEALNVRLSVTPPFSSLEEFFNPGMMGKHFQAVNAVFDGSIAFDVLRPGASYIWFLGRAPKLFEDQDQAPRRYEIKASYGSALVDGRFESEFVIDLDVEKRIDAGEDSLERIGKDLEVIGDKLEAIKNATTKSLSLDTTTLQELACRPSEQSRSRKLQYRTKRRNRF